MILAQPPRVAKESYLVLLTKGGQTMVRYPRPMIGLKLRLDATSKYPRILVSKEKPPVPPSDRVGKIGCDPSSSFKFFRVGHGGSTILCTVVGDEKQFSLIMEHGSNVDQLHVKANRNPRRIAGNLIANYVAANQWYLRFIQLVSDKVVDGLFGDSVSWSTASEENRVSLSVGHLSDIRDELRIETSRDCRRKIVSLTAKEVANYIAAGTCYLPIVQFSADRGMIALVTALKPLVEIAVNVLTGKNDGHDQP